MLEGTIVDSDGDGGPPVGRGLGRPYFLGAAVLLAGLGCAVFISRVAPWGPEQRTVLSVMAATAAATSTVPTGLLLLARYRLGGRRAEVDAGLIVLMLGALWLFPTRVWPMLAPDHPDALAPFSIVVALVVLVLAWSASRRETEPTSQVRRRVGQALVVVLSLGIVSLAAQVAVGWAMGSVATYVGSGALAASAGLMLLSGYRSERWAVTLIGMELLGVQMGELFASRSDDVSSGQWLAASFLALVGAMIGTFGALAVAQTSAEASQQALLGASLEKVRMLQAQATTEERLHDLRSGLFSVETFASSLVSTRGVIRSHSPNVDGHDAHGPSAHGPSAHGPSDVSVDLLVAELSRLRELVSASRRPQERFDLSEGLRQMVDARRAAGAHIELAAPANLEVVGNRAELCEAVQNLLDNARLHAEATTITLTVDVAEDVVRLSVADDGPGFDSDALPMVFERGFSTSNHGTGLGLHIVRQTIEAMGGTVAAMNRTGGGALVRLTFPGSVRRPVKAPDLLV